MPPTGDEIEIGLIDMAVDTLQTVVTGNLTGDPEFIHVDGDRKDRVRFSVAVNKGKDDNGQDRPAEFVDLTAFGQRARNIRDTLKKGLRVVAIIGANSYQVDAFNQEGKAIKVTKTGFNVYEIGPALSYATATVTKNPRRDGQGQPQAQGGFPAQQAQPAPQQQAPAPVGQAPAGDPWSVGAQQAQPVAAGAPWSSAQF